MLIKMAETQKNTADSSKDDSFLLDLDIGKDFLSSWKSMSMADDVAMDFDFAPVSKGKKKMFSFDKVDMNLNLDADFGKISSFNVDMEDLDISSPPQKGMKSKENSKTESSRENTKGKTDAFTFAFDFDGLGSFNFEPNIEKNDREKFEKKETFESSPDDGGRGCQDKAELSNSNINDCTNTSEKETHKAMARSAATHFDMAFEVGDSDLDHARKNAASVFPIDDSDALERSTSIEEGPSDKTNTFSQPNLATVQQKIIQSEKSGSPDQVDLEVRDGKNLIPDFSSQILSNDEPNVGNSSALQDKVDFVDTSLISSIGDLDVNMTSISKSISSKFRTSENSDQLQSVMINMIEGEKTETASKETSELCQFNLAVESSSTNIIVTEPLSTVPISDDNNETVSTINKFPFVSLSVGNVLSKNDTKMPETCSRSLLQSVRTESLVQKPSQIPPKFSLLRSQKVGCSGQNLVDEGRDWNGDSGNKKLAPLSLEQSKTPREIPRRQTQDSSKNLKICGMTSSADGVNHERKLINSLPNQNTEVGHSPMKQTEENVKGPDTLRKYGEYKSFIGCVDSSNFHTNGKSSRNRENQLILSSKITSLPTIKNSLAKEERIFDRSDLRSLNLSRLNNNSSMCQSMKSAMENIVITKKFHVARGISHIASSQKHTVSTLSLKRKTLEGSNADLAISNPSKRSSESRNDTRNVVENSERALVEKASSDGDMDDHCIRSTSSNVRTSTLGSPHEENCRKLEVLSTIGSDTNIKLSEVYTKELDEICNTLKKKNEEAKDTLARALVNNNMLLILKVPSLIEKLSSIMQ